MIIAVFGDLHGEIELLYRSCRDWQKKAEKQIDLILQVGDIGIEKDDHCRGKRHENEFQLYDMLRDQPRYDSMLNGRDAFQEIKAKLVFTRGNHDDPDELERVASAHPNSYLHSFNEHLHYLQDASPVTLYSDEGQRLELGCLGGIEPAARPGRCEKEPRIAFTEGDVSSALSCTGVDIFMTHMHPKGGGPNGSEQLSELVELIGPKFYFFGHLRQGARGFKIGSTSSYGMHRVKYPDIRNIEDGSMMVLEKVPGSFRVISE